MDYPSNSLTQRPPEKFLAEKEPVKVVKADGRKKKSEISKLAREFISDDATHIRGYVLKDVLLPNVKNTVYDVVVGSLNMLLFGSRGSARPNQSPVGRMSYSNYSGCYRQTSAPASSVQQKRRDDRVLKAYYVDSPLFADESDIVAQNKAHEALSELKKRINRYGSATVSDFNELVGWDDKGVYTETDYGWTNVDNVIVHRLGYNSETGMYEWTLDMPKVICLKEY